jgi:hypothetical protein
VNDSSVNVGSPRDVKQFTNMFKYKLNVKHSIGLCGSLDINKCNMQHLSNGFNTLKVNEWFNSCIDVDSSNNVKIFIKPFKYNCKTSSHICFSISYI